MKIPKVKFPKKSLFGLIVTQIIQLHILGFSLMIFFKLWT